MSLAAAGRQHLTGLSAEALDFACALRLRVYSGRSIRERVYKAFPDEPRRSQRSFERYFSTPEGQERLRSVQEDIRKRALERSLSHRGSRVDVLIDRAEALIKLSRRLEADLEAWRKAKAKRPKRKRGPKDLDAMVAAEMERQEDGPPPPLPAEAPRVKDLLDVNAELRQTLQAIKVETDGLFGSQEISSPIEIFVQALLRGQRGETVAQMAREELEPPPVPITPETAN